MDYEISQPLKWIKQNVKFILNSMFLWYFGILLTSGILYICSICNKKLAFYVNVVPLKSHIHNIFLVYKFCPRYVTGEHNQVHLSLGIWYIYHMWVS